MSHTEVYDWLRVSEVALKNMNKWNWDQVVFIDMSPTFGAKLPIDNKTVNEYPDSKVHGANMGPTWVLLAPDGPHVGPMNFAIRVGNGMVSLVDKLFPEPMLTQSYGITMHQWVDLFMYVYDFSVNLHNVSMNILMALFFKKFI